jgi:hypothetical protein
VQGSAFEGLEALGSPEEVAARIREGLERAREIAGGLGTLLVEIGRGAVIGAAAVGEGLDLEGTADALAQLLRARQLLAHNGRPVRGRDCFEEVVITSVDRQYLPAASSSWPPSTAAANLGMARLQLAGAATPAEPALSGAQKPSRR